MTVQNIFLLSHFLDLFLFLTSLGVLLALMGQYRKLQKVSKSLLKKEAGVEKINAKELNKAEEKSEKIIEDAVAKAQSTVLDADYLRSALMESFAETITKVKDDNLAKIQQTSDAFSQDYNQIFELVKTEYLKKTQESLVSISKATEKELDDFKKSLDESTVLSKKMVEDKFNADFEQSQQELATYKQAKMKQVDQEIDQIISQVVERLVGRKIPLEAHRDLVIEVLEQAKSEGFFA